MLHSILLFAALFGAAPGAVVERFVAAFNAHDADAMLQFVTDDVRWYHIDQAQMQTATSGRDALAQSMATYFKSVPDVRSTLLKASMSGDFLFGVERVEWGEGNAQCAVVVYQLRDDRISNVWYHAAHICPGDQ